MNALEQENETADAGRNKATRFVNKLSPFNFLKVILKTVYSLRKSWLKKRIEVSYKPAENLAQVAKELRTNIYGKFNNGCQILLAFHPLFKRLFMITQKEKRILLTQTMSQTTHHKLNQSCDKLKILVDGKLIFDVLFNRSSFFLEDAVDVIAKITSRQVQGYITQNDLENIWHLSEKIKGVEGAKFVVSELLKSFEVCKVDRETIDKARKISLNSFDDALLLSCASRQNLDAIVTTNYQDFPVDSQSIDSEKPITIFSPSEFLQNEQNKQLLLEKKLEKFRENLAKTLGFDGDNLMDEKLTIADWNVENFQVSSFKDHYALATVTLQNPELKTRFSESAAGKGPIDAICRALDRALASCGALMQELKSRPELEHEELPSYTFHSVKIQNIEAGLDTRVAAGVLLKCGDRYYKGQHIHRDSIKAAFYAYAQAIGNIVKNERSECEELLEPSAIILAEYANGKRDFAEYQLRKANLVKVNLSGVNLSNANLSGALMCKSVFIGAILSKANLIGATLKYADLTEAKLEGADLRKAQLEEAILNRADLFHANMSKATLPKAELQEAKLNKVNLSKANLSCSNLSNAILDNANLEGANLSMATLKGVDLTEANLTGADLSKADLSYAKLKEANFQKADLTGANLAGVDLTDADFAGAKLDGIESEQLTRILKHQRKKGVNSDLECLMLKNLANQLSKIFTIPNRVSLEMFGKLVGEVDLSGEFLSRYVCFNEEHFTRKLLFQNNYLTVYVIGWKPGQISAKHHHGHSLDAIRVVQGKLTHWQFLKIDKVNPDPLDASLLEGLSKKVVSSEEMPGEEFSSSSELILIDRLEPHQIANQSEEDSISVHFRFGAPPDDDNWEDNPDGNNPDVVCQQTEECLLINK